MSLHAAIEFGNRMLTFVLVAIAVATFLAAWGSPRRDLRVLAFVLALGDPGAGDHRRRHGAHRPEPVDRVVPPALLAGDDRAVAVLLLHRLSPARRRRRPAARSSSWRWLVVRGRPGWCSTWHCGDRLRSARRRRGRAAQRPRPAPGQPAARRRVFLFLGLSSACTSPSALSASPLARCGGCSASSRAPGGRRVRPVLHRPPRRPRRLPHARRRPSSRAAVTWVLLEVREPGTTS